MRGIIYCYIGYRLSQLKLEQVKPIDLAMAVGTFIINLACKYLVVSSGLNINILGIPTIYLYVCCISAIIFKLKESEFKFMSRNNLGKISVVIYFTHSFVINMMHLISNSFLQWFIVCTICTLIGMSLTTLADRGVKICKYLTWSTVGIMIGGKMYGKMLFGRKIFR